ncbi:MAG: prephenate dehydrogenase [Chloroflexi bacterium]|nr:prephenate dehydrogenase [Chloroflexota bacterium]
MAKPLKECSVAVVGLGLMGASLCMDLKEGQRCREVRGVARRTRTVLDAFFAGAVDLATNDLQTGVLGADLVVLATPARTILSALAEIGERLWPGTVVTDMGSTKGEICAAMAALPPAVEPVGGHPMCGKETAGFEAAERGLYRGATWVLTPLPRTSPDALALATELALAVGGRPLLLEPERHDRLVASISHLPFLVASALTAAVAEVGDQDPTVWSVAAGGFRDTSRVAASDTQMFLDILLTNRTAVLAQLERFQADLGALHRLLESSDEAGLRQRLVRTQQIRARWKPRT